MKNEKLMSDKAFKWLVGAIFVVVLIATQVDAWKERAKAPKPRNQWESYVNSLRVGH